MSHDKNGSLLRVGDAVMLQCRVESIAPRFPGSDDPCEVALSIIDEPSPGAPRSRIIVRGRQLEIIGAADAKPPVRRHAGRQTGKNGRAHAPMLVTLQQPDGSAMTMTESEYRLS